ncbi:hypothetical protein AG1IA_07245 [Rhizoctonia solani AG-1 IA]|uniref:Uncharacterized protein n=1 Tax=Thanatephorus cucumeris (strain AG1-IA) TaxID=983506 RepID=L8WLC0_THACA|nr:hypothetical protein AG1IA_07245 [Rhizoctonia solani AG-1 IA]
MSMSMTMTMSVRPRVVCCTPGSGLVSSSSPGACIVSSNSSSSVVPSSSSTCSSPSLVPSLLVRRTRSPILKRWWGPILKRRRTRPTIEHRAGRTVVEPRTGTRARTRRRTRSPIKRIVPRIKRLLTSVKRRRGRAGRCYCRYSRRRHCLP